MANDNTESRLFLILKPYVCVTLLMLSSVSNNEILVEHTQISFDIGSTCTLNLMLSTLKSAIPLNILFHNAECTG